MFLLLTTLHNFDLTNGGLPLGGLAQGTDGNFYGTTPVGGSGGIFKLSVGLGPFVKTLPTSGRRSTRPNGGSTPSATCCFRSR